MRFTATIAAVVLLVGGTTRPVLATPADQVLVDLLCSAIASTAETIMTARQNGVTLERILAAMNKVSASEAAADDPAVSTTVADYARAMVLQAFEVPHFQTEEVKQRAILDFRNDAHLSCLKEAETAFTTPEG